LAAAAPPPKKASSESRKRRPKKNLEKPKKCGFSGEFSNGKFFKIVKSKNHPF